MVSLAERVLGQWSMVNGEEMKLTFSTIDQ
jgi:hypothetical protein